MTKLEVWPLETDGSAAGHPSELAMGCGRASLQDVLDEFDLVYSSTLDGQLGVVAFEQLDDVQNRLVGLGFEFEGPTGCSRWTSE